MIRPTLEELTSEVNSRYTLVVMAARRARQVMNTYQKRADSWAEKPVTRALKEIAAGKVTYTRPASAENEAVQ
ncbi:MAG: DNA-directed RNA polymerase subunit omega [Bacillota bacterium]|nr:DNA-directed RNA polymerase subunit omega [Bacillota bacterium]